jgi:hypothetical protein
MTLCFPVQPLGLNPAFKRTPRRRDLKPRLTAVVAGSGLTSSC